jgi:uncharacterized protein YbjT (DUF2867 family)
MPPGPHEFGTSQRRIHLLTGATGLAGSAIVRPEHPVRVLVRNPTRATALRAFPTVEVVEGDLLRPQTLRGVLEGVDRALLLSSPDTHLVEAQTSFIDAAKSSDVEHIVKFSGLSAADIGTPFVFGAMHAEIESYLQDSGLSWTHLRPSQFMTEYLRELRRSDSATPWPFPMVRRLRDAR